MSENDNYAITRRGRQTVMLHRLAEYELGPEEIRTLNNWQYHGTPSEGPERQFLINDVTRDVAETFFRLCPPGVQRDQAIDALEKARAAANASLPIESS